jgi:hypothetical protein
MNVANYIDPYGLAQKNASELNSVPENKASMMLQAAHRDKGAIVMNQIRQGYMFESPNQQNK